MIKKPRASTLFAFLRALDDDTIHYDLSRHRDETVMVKVAVPGERWEVEFFECGKVEVEVFRSVEGGLEGSEALERLLWTQSESESS